MKKRSFGKILQMRSGRYQASYIDNAGVRRYAPDTFNTKQAAASWLADIRAKLNTNSLIDMETASKTFEAYAIDWLIDKK